MTIHDFWVSYKRGKGWEQLLDLWFSSCYSITQVTRDWERIGIDRFFTTAGGRILAVEYKTDEQASRTRNVFIETVSVDTTNKPGWAKTSQATILVYYVPLSRSIYIALMRKIKAMVPTWEKVYPLAPAKNDGYYTWGRLVPISEFEKYCIGKLTL